MSKRLRDTEIWNKLWFRKLGLNEKLGFYYILDHCDCVGIWDIDYEIAEIFIGCKVDWDFLIKNSNNNLKIINGSKLFIVDFCEFQYGPIENIKSPSMRKAVYGRLKKYGLLDEKKEEMEGLGNSYSTVKDKRQGYKTKIRIKDKDKRQKTKDGQQLGQQLTVEYAPNIKMTTETYENLCLRFGKSRIDIYLEKVSDYQLSTGKRYKDIPATIKNWMRRETGVDSIDELEKRHKISEKQKKENEEDEKRIKKKYEIEKQGQYIPPEIAKKKLLEIKDIGRLPL